MQEKRKWEILLQQVADGLRAGEITLEELNEATKDRSPLRHLAEVLHSVLCSRTHLHANDDPMKITFTKQERQERCTFYAENSLEDPWKYRAHIKWLGLSKFLLAALDLSIKDLLMEISYLQHDVEKDKFAFFYYLYHCPPDIMAKVSEFCELAQNLDKEET